MRADYVAGAMFEPDSMDIDVNALHQGFLRGARRRGARIVLDAEVESLEHRHGRWEASTRNGSYAAKAVVNAAGAWCDEVARLAGAQPVGLVPKRRTVFTFDPPAGSGCESWPLGIDVDEELFFKPDVGRLMCSPADETPSPPCDAQPEDLDIAIAVDPLGKATTLEVNRIVSRWAGLRSFVSDHSLVIGPDADLEGFYWVAGQGGLRHPDLAGRRMDHRGAGHRRRHARRPPHTRAEAIRHRAGSVAGRPLASPESAPGFSIPRRDLLVGRPRGRHWRACEMALGRNAEKLRES